MIKNINFIALTLFCVGLLIMLSKVASVSFTEQYSFLPIGLVIISIVLRLTAVYIGSTKDEH